MNTLKKLQHIATYSKSRHQNIFFNFKGVQTDICNTGHGTTDQCLSDVKSDRVYKHDWTDRMDVS